MRVVATVAHASQRVDQLFIGLTEEMKADAGHPIHGAHHGFGPCEANYVREGEREMRRLMTFLFLFHARCVVPQSDELNMPT